MLLAASRQWRSVTDVVISVRCLLMSNSVSSATVRLGSRPSSSAAVVASRPDGRTRQSESDSGVAPALISAPTLCNRLTTRCLEPGLVALTQARRAGAGLLWVIVVGAIE